MVEEVACALLDATRRMSMSERPAAGVKDVPQVTDQNSNSMPLSTSTGSTYSGGSGVWFGSRNTSTAELDDKTGSLPTSSWLGSFAKRNSLYDVATEVSNIPRILVNGCSEPRARTYSDSENQRVRIDVMGWLSSGGSQTQPGELPQRTRKISEPTLAGSGFGHQRIRRSSSKDVEEAMAGGLNKADIYMPPF